MLSLAACEAEREKKARLHLEWIMNLHRRELLRLAAGAAAFPAASRIAWAQAYPTRPVRIIVGFAAGGPGEMTARMAGEWLAGAARPAIHC
jgi:tripartite-type tricarboxylate transporter receptor subunit TctC